MPRPAQSAANAPIENWRSLKTIEDIDPSFQGICETYRGVCARLAQLCESKDESVADEIKTLRRRRSRLMTEIVAQWRNLQ